MNANALVTVAVLVNASHVFHNCMVYTHLKGISDRFHVFRSLFPSHVQTLLRSVASEMPSRSSHVGFWGMVR
ncbi:hypothetical protein BS17DRAFT_783018 [Gyrodon lividus]|nr:hypothetical protein BS17DRAFT_783018 [Gyrodon lividus]